MNLRGTLHHFKWLAIGIFLLVLAVMGFVIVREQDALATFPWRLDVVYLVLTVGFHSLALGVTFGVWHLMIARVGNSDNLRLNFRFYYISTLAKRIHSAIWYVGGRLVMYQQVGVLPSKVLNCILLENVIIGIAGIFTFLAFLPFYSQLPRIGVVPFTVVGIVGVLGLLARPQAFVDVTNWILTRLGKRKLEKIPTRKDILLWAGLYTLPWIFAGFSLYCATRAFTDSIGPGVVDAIGISTLAMLVALLSMILPGGLGLRELTSSTLLSYWMPFSSALVISIAYRLIQTVNEIIWALAATVFSPPPGRNE
jgi:hypothetical protein